MSSSRTVVQLREELKQRGLPTKGNKAELEARLREAEEAEKGNSTKEEQEESTPRTKKRTRAGDSGSKRARSEGEAEQDRMELVVEQEEVKDGASTRTETVDKKVTDAKTSDVKQDSSDDAKDGPKNDTTTIDYNESKKDARVDGRELEQVDTKHVHISTDSDRICENDIKAKLDALKSSVEKAELIISILLSSDESEYNRRIALDYARETLLLVHSSPEPKSFAELFLSQELLPEASDVQLGNAASRFFERAGELQKILFQAVHDVENNEDNRKISECVVASPATSVQLAIQNKFFLNSAVSQKLVPLYQQVLNISQVDNNVLVRGLTEYFGPRKTLLDLVCDQTLAPATMESSKIISEPYCAASIANLVSRLVLGLKFEIAFPPNRIPRVLQTVLKADLDENTPILYNKDDMLCLGLPKDCSTLKPKVYPLTSTADVSAIQCLRALRDLMKRAFNLKSDSNDLINSAFLHSSRDKNSVLTESTTAGIDIGHCIVNGGFNRLKECFPDENLNLENGLSETDRFVIKFNKGSVVGLPPSSNVSTACELAAPQMHALRFLLSAPNSSISYITGSRNSGKTELAAQLIATLFTVFPRSRILVYSGVSNSSLIDLLQKARKRSRNSIELRDIVVAGNDDTKFSLTRCITRFEKERSEVLKQIKDLAKSRGVEDPDVSSKSCEFASYFLASLLPRDQEIEGLMNKVEMLKRVELFRQDPTALGDFLEKAHVRIVGKTASTVSLAEGKDDGRFDFIVADECSSQIDLLFAGKSARGSSLKKIFSFGSEVNPGFQCRKFSLESSFAPSRCVGFVRRIERIQAASLKEEADFVLMVYLYAIKIGYSPEDVNILALTRKQCETIESFSAAKTKDHVAIPPTCFLERPQRSSKLLLVSVGGSEFSEDAFARLSSFASSGLFIFSCDKKWTTNEVVLPAHLQDKEQPPLPGKFGLVLGERVGDDYDESLRESTMYGVSKPSEMVAVVANL